MKRDKNILYRLLTISILITSLGTVGVSSMQDAWAMPGPICLVGTPSIVTGQSAEYTCWGQTGFTPHSSGVTVVYRSLDDTGALDTNVIFNNIGGLGPTGCGGSPGDITVSGTGGADGITDAYLLWDSSTIAAVPAADSTPSFWNIPSATVGPTLPPSAGTEDSATFMFPDSGITSVTQNDGAAGTTAFTGTPGWLQIGSGGAAATTNGNWVLKVCVSDDAGTPSVLGGDVDNFFVQDAIGGEILAINTAALLIAGLSTSAIWMIPAAGAVAGTAVTLYKLRQK